LANNLLQQSTGWKIKAIVIAVGMFLLFLLVLLLMLFVVIPVRMVAGRVFAAAMTTGTNRHGNNYE
jgi:hypothetical protein